MLHPSFIDNTIFALQQDGTERFLFMINEEQCNFFRPKSLKELTAYFEKMEYKRIEKKKQKLLEQQRIKQLQIKEERKKQEQDRIKEREAQEEQALKKEALGSMFYPIVLCIGIILTLAMCIFTGFLWDWRLSSKVGIWGLIDNIGHNILEPIVLCVIMPVLIYTIIVAVLESQIIERYRRKKDKEQIFGRLK